jgi:serine/threonine protein kinase
MIKTLQNYRILSQIGEGGMGIVYLGEHISLKRKVAIKALHPNFSGNNTIRQRFINEGITLSNLNHPNIVILYDFIEQSDGLYLVMEYVEGNTLDNLLETRKEPVKEEEFIPIFKKILNAFQYAHSRGIIHRDIKPSNILLNQYLEPKILDFGIAKIVM